MSGQLMGMGAFYLAIFFLTQCFFSFHILDIFIYIDDQIQKCVLF